MHFLTLVSIVNFVQYEFPLSSQPLSAEWQRQRQAGEFHWDLPEGDICFKLEDTMFAYNTESELKIKEFEIFSLKS